ncbi:hypothetical protein [Streptomyces sp. enrichment culture]|uniref:hypothetical protein n=1 Tax=Streptomyces sp. enrichment culture TaxID=1795815 RepID=UPI003F5518E3
MHKQTDRVTERRRRPAGLAMPRQAPPVDRTGATTANTPGTNPGVEPSNFLKTLTRILEV